MVTDQQIQDQIKGLKNTASGEVWCRTDIAEHVFGGDVPKNILVTKLSLSQKVTKARNLVEAAKTAGKVDTENMGCFDRVAYLAALEDFVKKPTPKKETNK